MVECGHLAFIKPAEVRAAFFPWHGDDLVDHDLRGRPLGIRFAGREIQSVNRRVDERARTKGDEHAVVCAQPVGLHDNSGSRLAVVSRRRNNDEVSALQGSGQLNAASMKASASFSSGRPRSNLP